MLTVSLRSTVYRNVGWVGSRQCKKIMGWVGLGLVHLLLGWVGSTIMDPCPSLAISPRPPPYVLLLYRLIQMLYLTGCAVVPAHVQDSTVPSLTSFVFVLQHLAEYCPHLPVVSVAVAADGDVSCGRTCSLENNIHLNTQPHQTIKDIIYNSYKCTGTHKAHKCTNSGPKTQRNISA